MKQKFIEMAIGVALVSVAAFAHAKMDAADITAAQEVFANNGCSGCHNATETVVGPALKDIAKRYKGKKAELEVATRIREGSTGRWGDGMHPANESIEPEDAKLLARWILNGAP